MLIGTCKEQLDDDDDDLQVVLDWWSKRPTT